MLSLINRIGDERMESLTTGDFLVINAMYHAESIPQNLRQNLKRLENLGLVEHIGRNRYVLVRSLYAAVGNPVYIRGSLVWIVKQTRNCY